MQIFKGVCQQPSKARNRMKGKWSKSMQQRGRFSRFLVSGMEQTGFNYLFHNKHQKQ